MLTEQLLGTIPKQQSELPDMVVKQVVDTLDRQVDGTSTEKDKLLLAGASVKVLSPKQDIYNLGKLLEQGGRAIVSCSNSFNFWASVRCSQLFKAYKIKPFEREVGPSQLDHRREQPGREIAMRKAPALHEWPELDGRLGSCSARSMVQPQGRNFGHCCRGQCLQVHEHFVWQQHRDD